MPPRKRTISPPGSAAPLRRDSSSRGQETGPNRHSADPGTSRGGRREGAGRPPRAGEPAEVRLELLTTQEERATLDAAAEKAGVRTGAFARDAALTVARAGVAADRVIPLRVTAEQYRALVDYADRGGMEIEDAIRDNVLGQCYQCSEAAILDARERPLCERCREDR